MGRSMLYTRAAYQSKTREALVYRLYINIRESSDDGRLKVRWEGGWMYKTRRDIRANQKMYREWDLRDGQSI